MEIEGGSYGIVAAIIPNANLLSVETASGELATYDPRRLTGVNVYRELANFVKDEVAFQASKHGAVQQVGFYTLTAYGTGEMIFIGNH